MAKIGKTIQKIAADQGALVEVKSNGNGTVTMGLFGRAAEGRTVTLSSRPRSKTVLKAVQRLSA